MIEKLFEGLLTNSASYLVGLLFAYLNYQIKQMQDDRKKKAEIEAKARDRQEKVDLWLTKVELFRQTEKYIKEGFISVKELADLEEGFRLYEDMGGNGEVKIRMGIIRELPHREEV